MPLVLLVRAYPGDALQNAADNNLHTIVDNPGAIKILTDAGLKEKMRLYVSSPSFGGQAPEDGHDVLKNPAQLLIPCPATANPSTRVVYRWLLSLAGRNAINNFRLTGLPQHLVYTAIADRVAEKRALRLGKQRFFDALKSIPTDARAAFID